MSPCPKSFKSITHVNEVVEMVLCNPTQEPEHIHTLAETESAS